MGAVLVYQHYQLLKEAYPDMHLQCNAGGSFWIEGKLHFLGEYSGQVIEDTYTIKVTIPEDYPGTLPTVQETGGRIPKDFHHYTNQSLCLGARFAVRKAFQIEPTLLGFVNRCVLPYLYSYSYKRKHGPLPFGELPHGAQGILEYYRDYFRVATPKATLGLLRILASGKFGGHAKCPCESRKRIRDCHGPQLATMIKVQSPSAFLYEYEYLVDNLVKFSH